LTTLVVAALQDANDLIVLVLLSVGLTMIVITHQFVDDYQCRRAESSLLAEKARAATELKRQARQDALTGLPNRLGLAEILAAEISLARLARRPLTLAFLDLNFFKAINDNFGHATGDQVLIEVGRRLEACVRAGDTVARISGDGFALILSAASSAQAIEVVNRVKSYLECPFVLANAEVSLGTAIGLATYPEGGALDDESLMHQAEIAMYQAKARHLDPTGYDSAYEPEGQDASDLAALRRCLTEEGLVLLFQPIWEPARQRTVGVEALVRWMHPTRGLLGAMDIIRLATQTGLIRLLDRRILDLACAQGQAWRSKGLSLRISVNLSRDSIQDPELADYVGQTLLRHDLPASALELEITEDGLLDNPSQASRFVGQMRELGVRMSIDDFGTGHSSLARLITLPVQVLKIDQSFVFHALTEPANAAIIESVVGLGHRLGLEIVAEGVEDRATLTYLEACGVDLIQGYLLGRPMSPEALFCQVNRERSGATELGQDEIAGPPLADKETSRAA
jgi:diguanylate cyclase (GGDEF)-like protein